MSIGHGNPGHELLLTISFEAVTNESFIFSQLRFQVQWISPIKDNYKIEPFTLILMLNSP